MDSAEERARRMAILAQVIVDSESFLWLMGTTRSRTAWYIEKLRPAWDEYQELANAQMAM